MTEPPSMELLLSRALEFNDAAERSGFLDLACAGDGELRREVESLVAAHLAADSFLKPRMVPDLGPPAENPGDRIGRYKLLEMIGEGGFGIVYLAEQAEPVRRKVALKVIKPGMDTREVVARFEAERQALALMDHPHIAQVYDGGATESGRPYFVMELVKGMPDHDVLRRPRPLASGSGWSCSSMCAAAVQHAHQKGIIHRDLKPSNILVSTHDGKPVVKVIDFGIAKAVAHGTHGNHGDDRARPDDRHAGIHESGAGGAQRAGCRHPQRHLFARRGALRAADRNHAARPIGPAQVAVSPKCCG